MFHRLLRTFNERWNSGEAFHDFWKPLKCDLMKFNLLWDTLQYQLINIIIVVDNNYIIDRGDILGLMLDSCRQDSPGSLLLIPKILESFKNILSYNIYIDDDEPSGKTNNTINKPSVALLYGEWRPRGARAKWSMDLGWSISDVPGNSVILRRS